MIIYILFPKDCPFIRNPIILSLYPKCKAREYKKITVPVCVAQLCSLHANIAKEIFF